MKKIMPNNNRSKKSREWTRAKALANGMREAQGILPYCQKCPRVSYCDNVFYNAKGMTDVWCADNPNERRNAIYKYDFRAKEIVCSFINIRYIGEEPKMEVCEFVEEGK